MAATAIKEEDGLHKQWYEEANKQTLDTLSVFLKKLAENYKHDYGTICHAIAAAAVGAAHAVERSPQGGITGFQAGAVMWEFIRAWNHIEAPAWIHQGENMLYPQYYDDFTTITSDTWKWLQDEARKKLAEEMHANPHIRNHWNEIVKGKVPFGYRVAGRSYRPTDPIAGLITKYSNKVLELDGADMEQQEIPLILSEFAKELLKKS